jgi:hypothetical protein
VLKYKVGDTVRMRSREWIEAQPQKLDGRIDHKSSNYYMSESMARNAGKTARITHVCADCYRIDIDDGFYPWEDWMFDPSYQSDEMLCAIDAV